MTTSLRNRNVVVLGLGLTGLSAARWAARRGAYVTVADTRADPPCAGELSTELARVPILKGPFSDDTFAGADLVVISPGITKALPAIQAAVARGVELVGDIELFARALRPGQRVLAVTGSNVFVTDASSGKQARVDAFGGLRTVACTPNTGTTPTTVTGRRARPRRRDR